MNVCLMTDDQFNVGDHVFILKGYTTLHRMISDGLFDYDHDISGNTICVNVSGMTGIVVGSKFIDHYGDESEFTSGAFIMTPLGIVSIGGKNMKKIDDEKDL